MSANYVEANCWMRLQTSPSDIRSSVTSGSGLQTVVKLFLLDDINTFDTCWSLGYRWMFVMLYPQKMTSEPQIGIVPATFWWPVWRSNHWATETQIPSSGYIMQDISKLSHLEHILHDEAAPLNMAKIVALRDRGRFSPSLTWSLLPLQHRRWWRRQ